MQRSEAPFPSPVSSHTADGDKGDEGEGALTEYVKTGLKLASSLVDIVNVVNDMEGALLPVTRCLLPRVSCAGDEKNFTPALGAGVMTSAGTGTFVTPADGTATVMPEHECHALRKPSFRSAGAWGITWTLAHLAHSSSAYAL
jgi:hypothetical protein